MSTLQRIPGPVGQRPPERRERASAPGEPPAAPETRALYSRRYFGGQRNEGLDRHQLELLLQGLANVVTLPTPEPKPVGTSRNGTPHPIREIITLSVTRLTF